MDIAKWLARRSQISWQRRQGLVVDPELLAGSAPPGVASLLRSAIVLASLPFIVWIVCMEAPERWIIDAGIFIDQILWSHIKQTKLSGCVGICRELAFGVIVLPICWIAGIVGAFYWYRCSRNLFRYQLKVIGQQPRPTSVRPSAEVIGNLFLRRNEIVPLIAVALLILNAAVMLPVGAAYADPAGSQAMTPATKFSFCFVGMMISLSIAGIGLHYFIMQCTAKRMDEAERQV